MHLCLANVKGNFSSKVGIFDEDKSNTASTCASLLYVYQYGIRERGGRQQPLTLQKTQPAFLCLEHPCLCPASSAISSTGNLEVYL